jgi:hypothetical protein
MAISIQCAARCIHVGARAGRWWHMPVIPATQEVELEGLWSEASSGKSTRPYLYNN